MQQDVSTFDLGELDNPPRGATAAKRGSRRARFGVASHSYPEAHLAPLGAGISTSLSIFVPGGGQILLGEFRWGFFFLTSIAFLGTIVWAVIASFDRLTRTLDLFGIPAMAIPVGLAALYALTAILHLCAVLHAHSLIPRPDRAGHPILMALASLLVPGWGQMRNGCYGKGTLFLGSLWLFAAAGILAMGGMPVLASLTPSVAAVKRLLWFKALVLAGPAVVWSLAVYDAAAYARGHRGR